MLTKFEKSLERKMHLEFIAKGGEVFSFPDAGVTVVMCEVFPGSKMVQVAIAITGADEPEFLSDVGRYHALNRFYGLEFLTMPRPTNWFVFAINLTNTITENPDGF